MAVYNTEKYLSAAIESILNQSYGDFEFIIIDDGSTDLSREIIKEYAEKDRRIVFKSQKKAGVIEAVNGVLPLARGKYIARMDSDDISLKDRFKKQYNFLENNPNISAVSSKIKLIDYDGKLKPAVEPVPGTANEIMWYFQFMNYFMQPAAMMRTAVFRELGGYKKEALHVEDYDLWVRMLEISDIEIMQEVLLHYRSGRDGRVGIDHKDLQHENAKIIVKKLISENLEREVSEREAEVIFNLRVVRLPKDPSEIKTAYSLISKMRKKFLEKTKLKKSEINFINRDVVEHYYLIAKSKNTDLSWKLRLVFKALITSPLCFIKYHLEKS